MENNSLLDYANVGVISQTLFLLNELAMKENWEYSIKDEKRPFPVLYNYLLHTFSRLKDEKKVVETDRWSCFNTGLVTLNQEEIFMLFKKSAKGYRFFDGFYPESDNKLERIAPLPERASYYSDSRNLIYDLQCPLRININHIIDDPDNFNRFPESLKNSTKLHILNVFKGAIENTEKRIKRNYKTAIPQYYRGDLCPNPEGMLQLLLPLCLTRMDKADLALAVNKIEVNNDGKVESFYSGRTCLTLDWAINNARLIAKPDDEWLRP